MLLAIARRDGYALEKANLVWNLFDKRGKELEQISRKITTRR